MASGTFEIEIATPERLLVREHCTEAQIPGERGYLGIAGQPAALSETQRQTEDRPAALLVVAVTAASPAAVAGVLVGDLLIDFDGRPVESAEDLLAVLDATRVGQAVPLRLLRGTTLITATVAVGRRPKP